MGLEEDKFNLHRYEVFRDYVKHEDSLINNRLTWLLISQGLIFNAYSTLEKSKIDACINHHAGITADLSALQGALGVVGLLICVFSFLGIQAARYAIQGLKQTWGTTVDNELPALAGGDSKFADKFGWLPALSIPVTLFFAWGFILTRQFF